jgi:hypothetical protein
MIASTSWYLHATALRWYPSSFHWPGLHPGLRTCYRDAVRRLDKTDLNDSCLRGIATTIDTMQVESAL